MTRQKLLFACVSLAILGPAGVTRIASAQEYVWARTAWGASNINARYSSMTNGYGGYYVPKNAAGNNYEAQGNFRNPTGYIVPANAGYQQTNQVYYPQRHWWHR